MTQEIEQMIQPLEDVFGSKNAENLIRSGAHGVIQIEAPIEVLKANAKKRGYHMDGVDPRPSRNYGMYWVSIDPESEGLFILYTKTINKRKGVYILDDKIEKFKKYFLEDEYNP